MTTLGCREVLEPIAQPMADFPAQTLEETPTGRLALLVLTALLVHSTLAPATGLAQQNNPLAEAQELLDAGLEDQALPLLDKFLAKNKNNAEGYFLRSTAQFLVGDLERGEADLERAIKLAPELRQAWLNLAGLRISQERYDAAYEALTRARELDPSSADNELNLGVVDLLRGRLEEAGHAFERYLEASGSSADAYYLVASNYAMNGYAGQAVSHLKRAIELDERIRLGARTDPNFGDLSDDLRFQDLLNNDNFTPPPGSYTASQTYEHAYLGGQGPLLGAVIDALRRGELPFNPRVEVTPSWALIWGEMRIKVYDADGRGTVELSAPPGAFTPSQWRELSERLLRQVGYELRPKVSVPGPR